MYWFVTVKRQRRCRCGRSKSDGFVSAGSLLALFGLFDYRARPEFCVCEPWGSLSLSLSPSPPTLAGVGQPIIHELNIQGIRLCVSRRSHSTVRPRKPTQLHQQLWYHLSTQLCCGLSRRCMLPELQNSIIVAGHYPVFCGIHFPHTPPPAPRITILHLLATTTDGPPEAFPGQEYEVDRDRRYDDVSRCPRAYEQRCVVMTGARAYDLSRKLLLVESFGIFILATRTCRETSTSAPSWRTRFAVSVTQRRSQRSSAAWSVFSRSTEPFPSGRSSRGTNWTTRDRAK